MFKRGEIEEEAKMMCANVALQQQNLSDNIYQMTVNLSQNCPMEMEGGNLVRKMVQKSASLLKLLNHKSIQQLNSFSYNE